MNTEHTLCLNNKWAVKHRFKHQLFELNNENEIRIIMKVIEENGLNIGIRSKINLSIEWCHTHKSMVYCERGSAKGKLDKTHQTIQ